MTFSVWVLITVFGLAVAGALFVIVTEAQRRAYVRRARHAVASGGDSLPAPTGHSGLWRGVQHAVHAIGARLPDPLIGGAGITDALDRAGLGTPSARATYAALHIAWSIGVLLLGVAIAPRRNVALYVISLVLTLLVALLAPRAVLDRLIAARQHRIRLGVPDALDLLVVCIEAGTALDASLQRVAREIGFMHSALGDELMAMTRRMSAGVSRADALTTLHERTGVSELRALSTHLIQSERWGTSVAAVLRVYARDLRRKRRLLAEKRAATAGTRMLIPLALFIFPTIFIVVLGPAMLQIAAAFREITQ